MKIEGPNPLRNRPVRAKRGAGTVNDGSFASSLGESGDAGAAGGVVGGTTIGSVDAMLALQNMDDALTSNRKQARARAESLLDRLDVLRAGLLTGSVPRDELERLARLAGSRRAEVEDPRLSQILDEIDLRAQVELAKLET